jgi:peptidoglycan/xylan/chitin deacetylase (PgdA/CDA1 family)
MRGSVILGYHRVSASPRIDPMGRGLQVAASRFRQHMEILARHFSIVPLEDLVVRLTEESRTDGMAAVTFDDGYADNHLCAFQILAQMGIPATIFLATGYIEHARPFWTDRLVSYLCGAAGAVVTLPPELGGHVDLTSAERIPQTYRELRAKMQAVADGRRREQLLELLGAADPPDCRPLTWEEIRNMHQQGIAFGAHTQWHPSLVALSDAALREEIEASRDLITARVGTKPTMFAYPFGAVDERVSRAVETAGFRGAVTTCAGRCGADSSRFLLPRLMVDDYARSTFTRELDNLGSAVDIASRRGHPFVSTLKAAIPRPVVAILRSIRSKLTSRQ